MRPWRSEYYDDMPFEKQMRIDRTTDSIMARLHTSSIFGST